MRINWFIPVLVGVVGCGTGATVASGPPVERQVALADVPSTIRTAALHHLEAAQKVGIAATWKGATLAPAAMAVSRGGEAAPTLYELAVLHDQSPAGYVAVDALRADAPILAWRTEGGLPDAATVPGLLAIEADLAPPDQASPALATTACAGDDCPPPPGAQLDWICKTAPYAPHWKQIGANSGANTTDCASGCGPTAWANVIAWISQQAFNEDPKWAPFKAIFREGGTPTPFSLPKRAPIDHSTDEAQHLLMTLHDDLSTHCRVGGTQGDTDATTAGDIGNYLDRVGLKDAFNVHYYGAAGPTTIDIVHDSVCNRQTPAVVSVWKPDVNEDSGFHIAVVTGILSFGNRTYYLFNLGQNGSDNGWFGKTSSFWLAGSLEPSGKAPPNVALKTGIRVQYATWGANCSGPGVFRGNATPPVAAQCDGNWDCEYVVDADAIASLYYETGTLGDPAPTCLKAFDVGYTCPDGVARTAHVDAGAGGKSVLLHCPGQCVPTTSCSAGAQCGTQDNGCGVELSCGTCTGNAYCENNRCIVPGTNCKADCRHQHDCANQDDPVLIKSCLQALNACNAACDCQPKTCASLGQSCGSASDGCGHTLDCGGCAGGYACTSGQCVCQPRTSCNGQCGHPSDGCGGTLNCGSCVCTPSCAGKRCGASDGCGHTCSGSCGKVGYYCTDDGDGLKYCSRGD